MHFVFLAAGKGSRIFKKINTNKCLIKIFDKSLIERLIRNIPIKRRKNITILTGFNSKTILSETKRCNVNYIHNPKYNRTEMVETLRLALDKINDDIVFSYSDILYDQNIIVKILKKKITSITVPVNTNWKKIWRIREKPIYEDAETLIIKKNLISEIGEKINKPNHVDGQFMGLIIIPKLLRKKILDILNEKKYKKYQTTKFLNSLIKLGFKVKPIKCNEHWYEFDDWDDYKNYLKNFKKLYGNR